MPVRPLLVNQQHVRSPLLRLLQVKYVFEEHLPCDFISGQVRIFYHTLRLQTLSEDCLKTKLQQSQLTSTRSAAVVLCLVDSTDALRALLTLNTLSICAQSTLICAYTVEEAVAYIHALCAVDLASTTKNTAGADVTSVLRSIRGVSKADIKSIYNKYNSFADICKSSVERMCLCPGFGITKGHTLLATFQKPFKTDAKMQLYDM